jgi:hypothetical protein
MMTSFIEEEDDHPLDFEPQCCCVCRNTISQGNCSSNLTTILGGLRNADTGLSASEVSYIPGCSTTTCHETDFSAAVTAAVRERLFDYAILC